MDLRLALNWDSCGLVWCLIIRDLAHGLYFWIIFLDG